MNYHPAGQGQDDLIAVPKELLDDLLLGAEIVTSALRTNSDLLPTRTKSTKLLVDREKLEALNKNLKKWNV